MLLGPAQEADPVEAGGEVPDAQHVNEVHVSMTRGQQTDWLCRGSREPLASMGIYHYAMCGAKHSYPLSTPPADRRYVFGSLPQLCKIL